MKELFTLTLGRQLIVFMLSTMFLSFASQAQTARIKGETPGATAAVIEPELDLTLTPSDAICNGDNNGEIVATWTGGTAPFKINLDGGAWIENVTSPYTFTNLPSGNYTVNLEDDDGLTASESAFIDEPAFEPINLVCGIDNMSVGPCPVNLASDFSDWLATFTVSGGTGLIQLTFMVNGDQVNLSDLIAPDPCGGSITVNAYAIDECEVTAACSGTFTVIAPDPVDLNTPGDYTTEACLSQDQVNTAFDNWLDEPTYSGGCGTVLTTVPENPTAPDFCGGSFTLTYTVTSYCEPPVTSTATFTVPAAPAVDLDVPGDYMGTDCMTQDEVDAAFTNWLDEVDYSGGCVSLLTTVPENPTAPNNCGGSITVFWTVTSDCEDPVTSSATFAIPAPSAQVVVTPPADFTADVCMDQADIDAEYAAWLASASITGGCNLSVASSVDVPPSACGSITTVTWTASSDCEADVIASATFTVPGLDPVVVAPPADFTAPVCMDQADIEAAFAAWLASASITGGCNLSVASNVDVPPSACGSVTSVTWTASSDCEADVTASATFTVPAPAPVVVTPPADFTAGVCMDQADIDVAFAAWLASASITGGCNLSVASSVDVPPSACGSVTTLTLSASSDCEADVTASATFTVPAPAPVVVTPPADYTTGVCMNQADIDAEFAAWLALGSATGGCNLNVTTSVDVTPSACGSVTVVTWTASSDCEADVTATATFTVPAPAPVVVTPPADYTAQPCLSQAQIDQLFADWVDLGTASGGCNLNVTTSVDVTPSACGSVTVVTWTASSDCEADVTATATFTVSSPAPVVVTPPANFTAPVCMDQADINAAFAAWLASASITGGCNLTVASSVDGSPSACGSVTTITLSASSDCEADVSASATFTVPAPSPVVITPPANFTADVCMDQADIDVAFAAWLATASITGGCNLSVASSVDGYPSACGSVTTITLSASSDCEPDVSASATFTVLTPDAVVATCPNPFVMPACATMDEIMTAYEAWKDGFSYTGECFVSDNMADFPAMDIDILAGGSISFTYMVTGYCSEDQCTSTFTIPPCGDDGCTLTPGYWMTHSEFGPAPYDPTWGLLPNGASTIFFLSGKSYYNVLWTPPAGNAYYNLSFHYIAAELNFLNGADPTAVQSEFDAATILFNTYTPAQIKKLKGNNPLRQLFLSLAATLDAYNNGLIGPGHCDSGKSSEVLMASDIFVEGINIYPNPVSDFGTIEFAANESTRTVIELYNLVGQKLSVLFDEVTTEGITYQVPLDAKPYQKGMYIVTIKTENSVQNKKVLISY